MSAWGFLQLCVSTAVFLAAASVAKTWTLTPSTGRLVLTLALYTLGNLIMLRLIRDFGMGVALSLSAVIERMNAVQGSGIAFAVLAVTLVSLGPYFTGR